jgi:hypothetical protein
MGSSVEQIDRTYGHLLPDSEEHLRSLFDAYDSEGSWPRSGHGLNDADASTDEKSPAYAGLFDGRGAEI